VKTRALNDLKIGETELALIGIFAGEESRAGKKEEMRVSS
jgi:hypothetical protein